MKNELLYRNSQPRPRSPAPRPHLLPGDRSIPVRLLPRALPSLPCRSENSVVHHPDRQSLQNSKTSVTKRSKTAPKRSKMVTETSKMAPNRSKSPRKRSGNSPVRTALTTHSHSIQYMPHAHIPIYCTHLRPLARLTTRASPAVLKKPRTANSENTETEDAPAVAPPSRHEDWGAPSGQGPGDGVTLGKPCLSGGGLPRAGMGCPFGTRAWLPGDGVRASGLCRRQAGGVRDD
jgi:hypothetical protein